MVEHYVRDVGAAGSNPVTSTKKATYPSRVGRFFARGAGFETKLQIFRAARCWENLGEQSGGLFDS